MSFLCRIGIHAWDGCRCERQQCYAIRHKAHRWSNHFCTRCYQRKVHIHVWDGCKCLKCSVTRHVWTPQVEAFDQLDSGGQKQWCMRCGQAMHVQKDKPALDELIAESSESFNIPT